MLSSNALLRRAYVDLVLQRPCEGCPFSGGNSERRGGGLLAGCIEWRSEEFERTSEHKPQFSSLPGEEDGLKGT